LPADPRPPKRIVDRKAGVEKLRREARCRACGRSPSGHLLDALNRAHLVSRGQGGDDVDANIVPLCGSGTSGCHGALTDHRPGWEATAAKLRSSLRPDELEYILSKKGQDWLERVYPGEEN
jgi:hypothetical protein